MLEKHSAISANVPIALVVGLVALSVVLSSLKIVQKVMPELAERMEVGVFLVGFMMCSSLMLIVNKVAITEFPYFNTVLACQLVSAAFVIRVCGLGGCCDCQGFEWKTVKAFSVVPLMFMLTVWANMQVLRFANVETFIMIRSATPLVTSLLDWKFLDRELPGRRSVCALLLSFSGALGYVCFDSNIEVRAYSWAFAWLVIFLFDQVYIKHIVTKVEMTTWTRSYYTNGIAAAPMLAYSLATEKAPMNLTFGFSGSPAIGGAMLLISCALGTAMSLFAFKTRSLVSATSFTVAGNACKIISVGINVLIWEKHATAQGLASLGVCLLGSMAYEQAPMRPQPNANDRDAETSVLKEEPDYAIQDENDVEESAALSDEPWDEIKPTSNGVTTPDIIGCSSARRRDEPEDALDLL